LAQLGAFFAQLLTDGSLIKTTILGGSISQNSLNDATGTPRLVGSNFAAGFLQNFLSTNPLIIPLGSQQTCRACPTNG
jgi:hypothetical protein